MTMPTKTEEPRVDPGPPARAGRLPPALGWLFPPLPALAGSHVTIPSLDGIRAMSILIVVVAHCGLGNVVPGGLGVTIFFFLSGYLITTLMRREAAKTGTIDLRSFYIRRCLRIIPPCYIVTLAALALAVAAGETLSAAGVLSNLGYFTNYYSCFWDGSGMIPGLNILWSLAVEEHFYLLFPLAYLAILGSSRRTQGILLATACLAVLAWRCVLVFGFEAPESRTYLATDTRLDSILWGCLLAVAANPALGDRWGERLASWSLGGVALAALVGCLTYRAGWFRETFRYTIQGVALMPLFALAIRRGRSGLLGFLNLYLMRLLGLYSYTIYLVHYVIVHYLGAIASRFMLSFPIVLGLSFALAALMYRFVDLPTAEIRRKYSR